MRRTAFTLIELMVTVGLIALLAGALVPTYQLLLSQFELSSATTQVSDFIRLTEQKTVTEQLIYGVTLTAGATSVPQFLYDPLANSKTTEATLSLPPNMEVGTVSFSGASDIEFSTSGAPTVSGSFTLTDLTRNRSRTVEVRPSGTVFANTAEF